MTAEAIRLAVGSARPFRDDWVAPDRSIIDECRRPAPPLPVDVFGPWQGWIEATAESTSSPADYCACALLAGGAALIGNSRWASPWTGWREPTALWVGLVGKPSSGKSPAMDPMTGMMRRMEADLAIDYEVTLRRWHAEVEAAKCHRTQWEADVKQATKNNAPPPDMPARAMEPDKPARPRLAVSDTTPEALCEIMSGQPRGVLVYRDELAGWLGSFDRYGNGSGERGLWLEAFGGRAFVLDRKSLSKPLRIPHLTISVLGGIQPDKLVSALMSDDDDGFAARILFTWPSAVRPRRPKLIVDDAAALAAVRRLLSLEMGQDENGNPAPVVLSLAPDAADLFDDWREKHVDAADTASGMLAGHLGKFPGLLLRLACVLQHLWWSKAHHAPPSAISVEAVAAAAGLLNSYFLPMAERAYGDAAMPEGDRLGATLARWIMHERPALVNATKVRREARLPGLRDAAKVHLAIQTLEELGWLRHRPTRDGSNPGRQKADYEVNPLLWGGQ